MNRHFTFALLSAAVLTAPTAGSDFPGGKGRGHRPPSLETLDTDGSGTVSIEEFVAPLLEHYAELDADGDGIVTSDEFVVRATEHFTAIDTNGDGVLTEAELQAGRPGKRR